MFTFDELNKLEQISKKERGFIFFEDQTLVWLLLATQAKLFVLLGKYFNPQMCQHLESAY